MRIIFPILIILLSLVHSQTGSWKNLYHIDTLFQKVQLNDVTWQGTNGGVIKNNEHIYTSVDGLSDAEIPFVCLLDSSEIIFVSKNGYIHSFDGNGFNVWNSTVLPVKVNNIICNGNYVVSQTDKELLFFNIESKTYDFTYTSDLITGTNTAQLLNGLALAGDTLFTMVDSLLYGGWFNFSNIRVNQSGSLRTLSDSDNWKIVESLDIYDQINQSNNGIALTTPYKGSSPGKSIQKLITDKNSILYAKANDLIYSFSGKWSVTGVVDTTGAGSDLVVFADRVWSGSGKGGVIGFSLLSENETTVYAADICGSDSAIVSGISQDSKNLYVLATGIQTDSVAVITGTLNDQGNFEWSCDKLELASGFIPSGIAATTEVAFADTNLHFDLSLFGNSGLYFYQRTESGEFKKVLDRETGAYGTVKEVAIDNRQRMWLITDRYIGYMCLSNVYRDYCPQNYQYSRIYMDFVPGFNEQSFSAISLDNRGGLWVGTAGNGLHYIPENKTKDNGNNQLMLNDITRYTSNNSGLLDDNVSNISYDNGTVWVAHAQGLSSLISPSRLTDSFGSSDSLGLRLFPNPFAIDKHKEMVIDRVSEKGKVIILSPGGKVVKVWSGSELRGGTIRWNGTNSSGGKVVSGVYTVIAKFSSKTQKAKVIVIH